jgi:hypothetical protein
MRSLITSNPRAVIESCPQEMFTAAGYPETINFAAGMTSRMDGHQDHLPG